MDDYETITVMNGLSDYDEQFIILNNIQSKPYEYQSYFKRKINTYIITDFQIKLNYEKRDSAYNGVEMVMMLK
jgi:hypothetical protein